MIFTRCVFSHLYPETYLLCLFNSRLGMATEAQKGPWIAEVGMVAAGGSEIKLNWWLAVFAATFGATVGGELRKAFC